MRPRNHLYPGAQGVAHLESSILGGDTASQRGAGGVHDHSALEEDTPATWETPCYHLRESMRHRGGPKTRLRRAVGGRRTNGRCSDSGREAHRTNVGSEIGRDQGKTGGMRPNDARGVGGLHMSDEVGERLAPDPAEQREDRARRELQEGTMTEHRRGES